MNQKAKIIITLSIFLNSFYTYSNFNKEYYIFDTLHVWIYETLFDDYFKIFYICFLLIIILMIFEFIKKNYYYYMIEHIYHLSIKKKQEQCMF